MPHACLEQNSTWDLVNDTEKIREHLNIDKWQVRQTISLCLHQGKRFFQKRGSRMVYNDFELNSPFDYGHSFFRMVGLFVIGI